MKNTKIKLQFSTSGNPHLDAGLEDATEGFFEESLNIGNIGFKPFYRILLFQPGESSKTLHGHLNLARLAAFKCEPLLNKALYQVILTAFPLFCPTPGFGGCRSY